MKSSTVKSSAKLKRTERGWPGHFCAVRSCLFRRNTLLEYKTRKIVVSTVGNYWPSYATGVDTIGCDRYYETMVFKAKREGVYWEADVTKQIYFESEWAIDECKQETDLKADAMHETVVSEISRKLLNDEKLPTSY